MRAGVRAGSSSAMARFDDDRRRDLDQRMPTWPSFLTTNAAAAKWLAPWLNQELLCKGGTCQSISVLHPPESSTSLPRMSRYCCCEVRRDQQFEALAVRGSGHQWQFGPIMFLQDTNSLLSQSLHSYEFPFLCHIFAQADAALLTT